MPYPNRSGKHNGTALITPELVRKKADEERPSVPETIVLCYHDGLAAHVAGMDDSIPYDASWGDGHMLGDVGVLRVPGIGAPTTALAMENHIVRGAKRFVIVGLAGSLQPDLRLGEFVVIDRALRDEGTSHHYIAPSTYVNASNGLRKRLTTALSRSDCQYRVGSTWTIDAIYRETVEEIRYYREEGVLTVDMEAAAVFAIAHHRGVEAGALFTISDHLDPSGWDPRFTETQEYLETAVSVVLDVA